MKNLIFTWVLLIFITSSFASDLIEADQLMAIMQNADVSIIACQKEKDYKQSHIKGAVNILHTDLYKPPVSMGLIEEPGVMASFFGNLGVSDKHTIVLYDDGSNKYAARLYWILKYLGAPDVRILKGHFDAWYKAGFPVTKNLSPVKEVEFKTSVNTGMHISMKDVKSYLQNKKALVVDVRTKQEFSGEGGRTIRKGHIPGAVHFYYEWVLDMDHQYKSREQILKIIKANGLDPSKEIVLYCASGVKASVVYFALTSICLCPNVKLYDGAFIEWESVASNPVVQ